MTNYRLRDYILDFCVRDHLDAQDFAFECDGLFQRLGDAMPWMLNLLGSHDTPRLLTLCGGDARRAALAMTALVAMGDLIAFGALEAALQSGMVVPDDLSIIGFDDISEARWVRPALTTVRQPAREKGRVAAEQLIGLLGGTATPHHINLETELIERASVSQAPEK